MVDESNPASKAAGHGLLCPACKVDLVMSDRQGIEIDYCPKCRGVWLDRGELDKIIERSAAEDAKAAPAPPPPPPQQAQPYPPQGGYESDYGYGGHHGRGRKHHSFLGRLFD